MEKKYNRSFYPILSFNTNDDFNDIAIPTNHEWQTITQQIFPSRCQEQYILPSEEISWEDKKSIAVFRGNATGCSMKIKNNPRLHVSKLDVDWKEEKILDAAVVNFVKHTATEEGDKKVYKGNDPKIINKFKKKISCGRWNPEKKYMSLQDQSKFKYIINIEGNSAAYRLSYLLFTGSVILNVECKNKLWWETLWKPVNIDEIKSNDEVKGHYIPITRNLNNLKKTITWCTQNDEICKKIANNAREFANTYMQKNAVFDYLKMIINKITNRKGDVIKKERKKGKVETYKINIIIPYRNTPTELAQFDRKKHLETFVKKMKVFIPNIKKYLQGKNINSDIDITVVEQTEKHKFNRGALLNIGFKQNENYDAYIFHDVDLIPNDSMVDVYGGPYAKNDIAHIASEWERWKGNKSNKYLGGVLLVGKDIFKKVNGFPNNFFGWGGEDDELRRRFETHLKSKYKGYIKFVGKKNGLNDLEKIKTAREKLDLLTETDKNPVRWEGESNHKSTWKKNGLNQNNFYNIIDEKEETIEDFKYKTVKVELDYDKIKPFEKDEQLEQKKKKKK